MKEGTFVAKNDPENCVIERRYLEQLLNTEKEHEALLRKCEHHLAYLSERVCHSDDDVHDRLTTNQLIEEIKEHLRV